MPFDIDHRVTGDVAQCPLNRVIDAPTKYAVATFKG